MSNKVMCYDGISSINYQKPESSSGYVLLWRNYLDKRTIGSHWRYFTGNSVGLTNSRGIMPAGVQSIFVGYKEEFMIFSLIFVLYLFMVLNGNNSWYTSCVPKDIWKIINTTTMVKFLIQTTQSTLYIIPWRFNFVSNFRYTYK